MIVRIIQCLSLACMAFVPSYSHADTIVAGPPNPVIALLKMSMALAVVLGLLWVFATVLKRFQAPAMQAKSGLRLVSTYNLGQREKLIVMQVGEEQLLLGVSPSAISTLHVLPTPLDLRSANEAGSFKKTLNAAMNKEVLS